MLHLQPQKDVDLAHQKLLLYIVPSYGYHINEEALWKDSQQSIYSQCKSGSKIWNAPMSGKYKNIKMQGRLFGE